MPVGTCGAPSHPDGCRAQERVFPTRAGHPDVRVRVSMPEQAPPAQGYALMLMLDGLAVEPLTARYRAASAHEAIVFVFISHVAQGDAAKAARVYDYTPSLPGQPEPPDPRVPHWANGGADRMLAWIEGTVLPWVQAAYPIDPRRVTFYGHSYGGLCVLHALARHAVSCTRYIAVSPSVWWQQGAIARTFDGWTVPPTRSPDVLMLVGSREAWHPNPTGPDGSPASRRNGISTLTAARDLAERLGRCPGVQSRFDVIEDATHHTMLAESIAPACSFAARASDVRADAVTASRPRLTLPL